MEFRECSTCGVTKEITAFEKVNSRAGFYHRNQCMSCKAVQRNNRTNKDPILYLRRAFSQLKSSRIRKSTFKWDLCFDDIKKKWEDCKGKCSVSGMTMTHHRDGSGKRIPTNVSIDRINGKKGYTIKNVRLVCWGVNIMKHTMSDDELMLWVNRIYDGQRS
tara:strand:+ start:303 stop:785 length:483 start_codon:yes stop_codon:yes gene_type:complete